MIKPLQPGFARGKTIQPPCGRGNAPLLVAGATTFPPVGDFILRYALSDERVFAVFYSAPCIGGSPVQPDRGASVASQSAELFSCHMTLKVNPVTLTL